MKCTFHVKTGTYSFSRDRHPKKPHIDNAVQALQDSIEIVVEILYELFVKDVNDNKTGLGINPQIRLFINMLNIILKLLNTTNVSLWNVVLSVLRSNLKSILSIFLKSFDHYMTRNYIAELGGATKVCSMGLGEKRYWQQRNLDTFFTLKILKLYLELGSSNWKERPHQQPFRLLSLLPFNERGNRDEGLDSS